MLRPHPVEVAVAAADELGEGPLWDLEASRLLWVDIARGLVHAWTPGGPTETVAFDGEVSAVAPRADSPGWVVAVGRELVLVEPDARRLMASVEPDRPSNRFNDCRCDAQGRLWAGTMSKVRERGSGALYRVEPGGQIERVIAGTTVSNGLGWSPHGDTMYFIDSPTRRIDAFDFEEGTGAIGGRRPFARVDPRDGLPDGLAVDAEGGVWVALFGGSAIRRYSAEGELEAHIPLPVKNPTCPAFGGAALDRLYVTTARDRLPPERLAPERLAGAVLALEPGVAGLPAHPFGG